MSARLVVTSEDEGFIVVARHIQSLLDDGQGRTALADTAGSTFYSECEELFGTDKFDALLDKFTEQFDVLFTKASDGDLETCLNVCVHLLPCLGDYAPEGIQKLSQAVRSKTTDHVEIRLATLVKIFNVADDSQSQFKILLDAISFAKATSQSTLLATVIRNRLDSWIEEWGLTIMEQRRLFLAAADLFKANKKRKALIKESYKLTARALSTTEELPQSDLRDLKPIAATAVTDFIRNPDVFQFDLLHLAVVRQLEEDPEEAQIFRLLQILIQGDVKGLEAFLQESSGILESGGFVSEDLKAKTRLMSLLALATTSSQVSFASIKERLDLESTEEVEEWLVRAMGKKLLEGQMDQVKQQVAITKSSHRTFGPENWELLQKQLGAWKVSVEKMRGVVQHSSATSLPVAANGVHA